MPPLLLEPSAVRAQLASDRAAAQHEPRDALARARRQAYRELNVAEHEGSGLPGQARARNEAMERALAAFTNAHGADVVASVRAADVERLEPALRGDLPAGERVEVLGGFVAMMERYGLVRSGRTIAPRFVIRTLFKARWNALHGLALLEGLAPIERRAYWGWLALRSDEAPFERRLQALEHYRDAGGVRIEEARAVLQYDVGQLDEARASFLRAYSEHPSFRLRNHALACEEGAAPPVED